MRAIFRDPLPHFIGLALLLLGANAIHEAIRKPDLEITPADVEARAALSADMLGCPLTGEEKSRLSREMFEDEILFREAQKRGMIQDNHVRETLISMMRSTLKPVAITATDKELRAILAAMPRENTTLPAQLAFDHVSFASDASPPPDLLEKLRSGTDPKSFGDPLRLANPFPPTYRPQLERLFGNDFAPRVFSQPLGEWHGPIPSTRGIHFIRLTTRQSESPLPMEQLRPLLETRWQQQQENAAVAREADRLAAGYKLILPPAANPPDAGK